ncbi:MAG: TIGR04053 family radical SAM/SPASM domain-containing protein [Acidobacteriota bacterium]|nr:TIGR04053 family radical SAM/SPASM domain-containing protein [Acidobacteriota bacterium]
MSKYVSTSATFEPRNESGVSTPGRFDQRPLLVFWEMTKACDLACRHCRASAQREPAADELTLDEGRSLIDELASLGSPRPILILTGGDCLKRRDLFLLLDYAASQRVPVALAPSVTPLLNVGMMNALREHGVHSISLSLDGALAATHDGVRGVANHFAATCDALASLKRLGFRVQVNTTVMRQNVDELAAIAALLQRLGVDVWEVFFVVTTGRASEALALTPPEIRDVCELLVEAARYGMTVRTVEAPYFRRTVREAAERGENQWSSPRADQWRSDLRTRLGPATHSLRAPSVATRDGKGVIFVSSRGEVYASGFLPLSLGNVRSTPLMTIYREHHLLRQIRAGEFRGGCASCASVDLCGGSRARAFATFGDPLGVDPACPYQADASRMLNAGLAYPARRD